MTSQAVDILVMGAGAVGCFIGGSLAATGARVAFVGRHRVLNEMLEHGLTLTDLEGRRMHLAADSLRLYDWVPAGARPGLVLLTVKSGATAEAAEELASTLPPGTAVLSLQNGVSNVSMAAAAAPGLKVLPGMVPYNIAQLGPGAYHRGTSGRLAAQDAAVLKPWLAVFERAGIPLDLFPDLAPIQWGKLLYNLNNPVNALSGLSLRDELMQRGFRVCFAALVAEALRVLDKAGIEPAQLGAVPPRRFIGLLRLPSPIFRLVAARKLRFDAQARSSMADDLERGRPTEIDFLSGELVRLAKAHGATAPLNAKMVELLHAWPEKPQRWTARQLRAEMGI